MVALTSLMPASFRGARFLVPRDTVKEGRNSIEFKYPGNLYRYVEDNGGVPPEFDITAYLHGATLARDYSALRNALLRPGPGTLNHPWYGSQLCSVKGPHQVTRDDKDSGVLELKICFLVTGPPVFPGLVTAIPAAVTSLATTAVTAAFTAFGAGYSIPASPYSQAFLDSVGRNVATSVSEAFPVTPNVSAAAAATEIVIPTAALASAGNLAGTAAPLNTAFLGGLLSNLQTLFSGPFEDTTLTDATIFNGFKSVFAELVSFAVQVDGIPSTTQDLINRQAAADIFVTCSMAACFASLCQAAAGKAQAQDYQTAEDVEADQQEIYGDWAALSERSFDAGVRAQLLDLLTKTGGILGNLEVTLPKIVAISVASIPASVLSYWLYDTDARELPLAGLNPDLPPMLYDDRAVNVFMQDGLTVQ